MANVIRILILVMALFIIMVLTSCKTTYKPPHPTYYGPYETISPYQKYKKRQLEKEQLRYYQRQNRIK